MADVELVIKISEEDYENIKDDVKKFLSMPSHKVPVLYKAVNEGIPFEDIKVEIQNTILEQAYEKGQIDMLDKIKAEFEEDKYILLNQNTAIKVIDNYIKELKGENKWE